MKKNILGISLLTITCLYGLLAGVVILIVLLCGGNILYAILGSLIVLVIQFLIAPWLTDLSMKFFYKAKFDIEIPEYLKQFIANECQKYNFKYPKIGVIEDGAPNAFTYGRTKNDARIVITRGIFNLLNEQEVKAVVGHEIGHIVHYDMLVMTVAQVIPLVLYAIYEIFAKQKGDKDSKKLAIIGYIAYILYLISQYIILWLSRTREYYADQFSVEETANPFSLAEALVKIGFGLSTNDSNNKHSVSSNNALGIMDKKTGKALAISSMNDLGYVNKENIKNAMKWEMWNPWAFWYEIKSTHPLISKRLIAINKYCEKYNQNEYIVFDLNKPESYVDDFALELFISFLPVISVIATLICCIIMLRYSRIVLGVGVILTMACSYIKFKRSHKTGYSERKVSSLLGEVKVSHITSIPCILKGTIIGRGNPGCIFNEDFVIKDDTGIIFLDYNQPLKIVNKIFALFRSSQYFNKEVEVKGWYRRSPVPYVEIYEYTVDGKKKRIFTYALKLILLAIGTIVGIMILI